MSELEVPIKEGVEVSLDGNRVNVSGPKGKLHRVFGHPHVKIKLNDGKIVVSSDSERRKDRAVLGTWRTHLKNMMTGVSNGYECGLRLVYAHFPVKLELHGDRLLIKNFLGARSSRSAKILEGVEVKIEDENVRVSGIDKEKVGQTAANIEQATKIKGFDRRVFQDGVYITQKPTPIGEGG